MPVGMGDNGWNQNRGGDGTHEGGPRVCTGRGHGGEGGWYVHAVRAHGGGTAEAAAVCYNIASNKPNGRSIG